MNKIEQVFSSLGKRKALVAYVTLGYPSIEKTLEIVPVLEEEGCDIIELGIPFSDPMADGVTIQNASQAALENGVTAKACFEMASDLSKKVKTPLIFMTYYNPVFSYGLGRFIECCKNSGISGLIIPDLPPDESGELEEHAKKCGIDIIYLLPPTATADRIKLVSDKSEGFIYIVSKTGITGGGDSISGNLGGFVASVKKLTSKPLCVGFGISNKEQAGEIAKTADGIIIGSKIVKLAGESQDLEALKGFIKGIRRTLDAL